MIIVSGGIKGGSGKSTLAVNLAIMLAAEKRDVLLVDADDQESASDFTILRNENHEDAGYTCVSLRGKAIRTEVLRQKGKYTDIVIDCGGRDTTNQRAALSVADVYLIPFVPRSFDVWTLDQVDHLVEEMQSVNDALQSFIVLNRADPAGHDNDDAISYFGEYPNLKYLDAPIGNRKAFAQAASKGRAVVEYTPRDQKAIDEIGKLYDLVKEMRMISQ